MRTGCASGFQLLPRPLLRPIPVRASRSRWQVTIACFKHTSRSRRVLHPQDTIMRVRLHGDKKYALVKYIKEQGLPDALAPPPAAQPEPELELEQSAAPLMADEAYGEAATMPIAAQVTQPPL